MNLSTEFTGLATWIASATWITINNSNSSFKVVYQTKPFSFRLGLIYQIVLYYTIVLQALGTSFIGKNNPKSGIDPIFQS
jgi:hypothetical protein